MFTISETRSRERDRDQRCTGRASFSSTELSSRETLIPLVVEGTQGGTRSGMLAAGKV